MIRRVQARVGGTCSETHMAERRTSAAKDVFTPREQALLETYGVVSNYLDHARDPAISRQLTDQAREQVLDQAREESDSFLADGGRFITTPREDQPCANDNVQSREGSQMVEDDKPSMELRPTPKFAAEADRKAFDAKCD